jgi:hypothetical protein
MFSLKAHQSENKIISVLKLSCKDDFNQAKFNKYKRPKGLDKGMHE